MPMKETTPVRIYDSDKAYLMLMRGNGTPADALHNIIKSYSKIREIVEDDIS